ncbi:MAG: glycosyl hydrolase [bacterium]
MNLSYPTYMKHKNTVCLGAKILGMLAILQTAALALGADSLERDFLNPPAMHRPATFAFMHTTGGPVADQAICRDIEEMKKKGISSVLFYFPYFAGGTLSNKKLVFGESEDQVVSTEEYKGPGAISETYPPTPRGWSPEWRKTLRLASKECGRLGVEMGISMGGAGCENSNGSPTSAQKNWVVSSTRVTGTTEVDLPLAKEVFDAKGKALPYVDTFVLALPDSKQTSPDKIQDLTGKMDAKGRLNWNAPAGDWVVLRFGYVQAGRYIDHLSAEALNEKWDNTMAVLLAEMSPEERKGLSYVECDSYEGGPQTWTPKLPEEFRNRRGYDLKPWLPVLAGKVVGSPLQSACFKRDYELTISDLYASNHYARHTALANANGLNFCSEAAGPHQAQTDVLKSLSQCQIAMGEFWTPGTHRGTGDASRFLLRDAAAAAHGYGKRDVFCEAFTGGRDPWQVTPYRMKPAGDQAFCDGLTRPCIHGYNISPWPDSKPGLAYWAGVYFNRQTTWWDQAAAPFLEYLGRCSDLLSQGLFVADVAYYTGDGIGQLLPFKAAYKDFPGDLYDYDRMNADILLTRVDVANGRLVLPDGMSYRLLVLQDKVPFQLATLKKFRALIEKGAVVLGNRPTEPFGLLDDPECFRLATDEIWGTEQTGATGSRALGKGRIIWGKSLQEVLAAEAVEPDIEITGKSAKGIIRWIHRHLEDAEIYFLCSRWEPLEHVECSFRIAGKVPEIWNPLTGKIQEAHAFRQEKNRTVVPLEFEPYGSTFIVFRKPTSETARSGKNGWEFESVQTLSGPWTVQFDPEWFYASHPGKLATTLQFEYLSDWTSHPLEAVKFYSGTATYRKEFIAPQIEGSLYLDLGEVWDVACVRLNGTSVGTCWTKPNRLEITRALKSGQNVLEVDVVNQWPNRLIGDSFLPKEQRRTRTNIKYTQTAHLYPSGLLGPVQLLRIRPPQGP